MKTITARLVCQIGDGKFKTVEEILAFARNYSGNKCIIFYYIIFERFNVIDYSLFYTVSVTVTVTVKKK